MKKTAILLLASAVLVSIAAATAFARPRWTAEQARTWQRKVGWLVGCNYTNAGAINQLEMWQADTFDARAIDRELGWAANLGFNSLRVFLHDQLWRQDAEGLYRRMDQLLQLAHRHGIGIMFVLLDSVWDPHPHPGKQRAQTPHLHNSGWVQSPGAEVLRNPRRHDELKGYVQGVLRRFARDARVQVWDLWNEPDNLNKPAYWAWEPANKPQIVTGLLTRVFGWAREANPTQPLTSGVWAGDWSSAQKLRPWERVQLEESDVISYHSYDPLPEMRQRVTWLKRYRRPLLCTEYMARPRQSTFATILPLLKEQGVGAYSWGFVAGKTQTIYPWDSWEKKYSAEPPVWFHDILRRDGRPYSDAEAKLLRELCRKK